MILVNCNEKENKKIKWNKIGKLVRGMMMFNFSMLYLDFLVLILSYVICVFFFCFLRVEVYRSFVIGKVFGFY